MPRLAKISLQAVSDLLDPRRICIGHFLLWRVLQASSQSAYLFSMHKKRPNESYKEKIIIIKAGQQNKHKFNISQETSGDLYFSVASQQNEFVVMAWCTNYYDLNKVYSISNTIQNYSLLKNSA